uniref:Uncharacterized protein n=1 Tax=Anguilla anguilla TaxID=7936 RepID=A0A0E9PF02_ANGAN
MSMPFPSLTDLLILHLTLCEIHHSCNIFIFALSLLLPVFQLHQCTVYLFKIVF